MKHLKIVCTEEAKEYFETDRDLISAEDTDYTDVAVVVVTDSDNKIIDDVYNTKFGLPVFVVTKNGDNIDSNLMKKICRTIDKDKCDFKFTSREIETAARQYEDKLLPPFFKEYSAIMRKRATCNLIALDIRVGSISESILQEGTSTIFMVKMFSVRTYAMQMWHSAIF